MSRAPSYPLGPRSCPRFPRPFSGPPHRQVCLDFPSLPPTSPAAARLGKRTYPEARLAGVSGCARTRHRRWQQEEEEEEDRLSGASLPTHRHWLLGGLPAEHQDRRRGSHTSNSCCAGLGSIRLSGAGAGAVRIGKKGRSGVQRAGQRASRSGGRRPGRLGTPPRGCRCPG